MSRILVVGATRALRPAVLDLVAAGHDVVGVARSAAELAQLPVTPVPVDFTDLRALIGTLPTGPFEAAVLYAPTAPAAARRLFAERTRGPVVELLTSAAADPAVVGERFELAELPTVGTARVLLGWTATTRAGWHTPAQLSTAALAALADGQDRILGVIRPWSERP